jgi:hypothetical protein
MSSFIDAVEQRIRETRLYHNEISFDEVRQALTEILAAAGPVEAILLSNTAEHTHEDYGDGYFATLDCVVQLFTAPPAVERDARIAELERTVERQQTALELHRDQNNRDGLRILGLSAKTFARFSSEECWIYQGEGDELESLVCPVVIAPRVLHELRTQLAAAQAALADCSASHGRVWANMTAIVKTINDGALTIEKLQARLDDAAIATDQSAVGSVK